jgi:hypothetical protein
MNDEPGWMRDMAKDADQFLDRARNAGLNWLSDIIK